jgi:hypothetical protein
MHVKRAALLLLGGLAACLQPGKADLFPESSLAPTVLSTLPSDGGIAFSVPLQVTFSKDMDPETLRPGIALYTGNPAQEVPLILSVPPPPAIPDFARTDPSCAEGLCAYTVTIQQASGGSPCPLPDGGTSPTGCMSTQTAYLIDLRTLLTDTTGLALPNEVQIPFVTF